MRHFLVRQWFFVALGLGIGGALLFPRPFHLATQYWEPRTNIAASLFLIAWTMSTGSFLVEMKRPLAAVWAVVLSYTLVPLAAWGLGRLSGNANVEIGLLLIACVPCTLSAAVLWTRMAGGNEATALLAVVGTILLGWLLTSLWLTGLTSAAVPLRVGPLMVDLVLILVLPVIGGQVLRRISACKRFADMHRTAIGVVSQLLVLVILLRASASIGFRLREGDGAEMPWIVGVSVVLSMVLHMSAIAASFVTCRWLGFDRGQQIAVAFSASQKTIQVSLALFDEYYEAAFPYAIVPMVCYHVGQLIVDTFIAKKLRQEKTESEQTSPGSTHGKC